MQPGKLAWLPGPPFSLPTGDPGSLPTSRRSQNPLLVRVQQPRPIGFSPSFCKSTYFLSEREQALGAASPVLASRGWNGHKTTVCSRRAARLRRCHPAGPGPGPGRREDSKSGPGRLRSAEPRAARLARRPRTAQPWSQAAAPARARTVREGVPPTDSRVRRQAARDHRPERVRPHGTARIGPAAFHLPRRLARPRVHPSRGWLRAPAQAHCPAEWHRLSPLSCCSTGARRPHSPLRHGRCARERGRM